MIGVVTHDNLEGLRRVVAGLLPQARDGGARLFVVDNGAAAETKEWLRAVPDDVRILELPENVGPGGGRNAVLRAEPDATAFVFLDDDVILEGGEVRALLAHLEAHPELGLVGGFPTSEAGEFLAPSFRRRALAHAVPRLWERWWRDAPVQLGGRLEAVDAVGGSAVAIRGDAIRAIGEYDELLWPACYEDLDLCARIRFRGFLVGVDRALRVRQARSVTMLRVLGPRHPVLCRSSGVVYAALDYPAVVALGRLLQCLANAVLGASRTRRRGDADGFLRCMVRWRDIVRGRRARRALRTARPRPR